MTGETATRASSRRCVCSWSTTHSHTHHPQPHPQPGTLRTPTGSPTPYTQACSGRKHATTAASSQRVSPHRPEPQTGACCRQQLHWGDPLHPPQRQRRRHPRAQLAPGTRPTRRQRPDGDARGQRRRLAGGKSASAAPLSLPPAATVQRTSLKTPQQPQTPPHRRPSGAPPSQQNQSIKFPSVGCLLRPSCWCCFFRRNGLCGRHVGSEWCVVCARAAPVDENCVLIDALLRVVGDCVVVWLSACVWLRLLTVFVFVCCCHCCVCGVGRKH